LDNFNTFTIEAETAPTSMVVAGDICRSVEDIDPTLPLSDLSPADETLDKVIGLDRLFAEFVERLRRPTIARPIGL
jgi:hypothetical protein